jgi:thiosulfate/3-mercaptopyruvate sulfurtransferase
MAATFDRLTTEQVHDHLDDPMVRVIDVRPVEAYNGWRVRGEERGGHIASAGSLPLKWSGYIDWPDIVEAKRIRPEHTLVIYGYEGAEAQKVAAFFSRAGYEKIAIYDDFIDEWSSDETLPMERLTRYRHLVSATWLEHLLRTKTAPELDTSRFVLCHAHYRNRAAYDRGHIPGAIELDTNLLESSRTWNRRSPRELQAALESLGITHDTTAILYGRFSFPDNDDPFPGSSAGQLGAFRCAFIMLYAGVRDVRILNGGLQSWIDEGYATTTEEAPKRAVPAFGVTIPARPELAVDLARAREMLRADDANLVSVRSWPEYIGEVSGYTYIKKKGRIPGSVFGNCGSDAYHMENYRNLDHTTREYHEIERLWFQAGITPDKHNAFYCGTGWRGSEAFFNAWLMGWPRVSVFDGGWYEWSNDESNPIDTGTPRPAPLQTHI